MSATTHDAIPESSEASLRLDPVQDEVADPTEDLANEVTSELTPARRSPKPAARAPIGHGIAEIEPIGRTPMIAAGTVLRDRYVLERLLASGGTSLIFRAHDLRRDANTAGGPRVAVKLLRPELRSRPHHVARLQREFRQTQALPHPGVVRFHDLDCDRGTWFIVMELLTGETLGPRLRRKAPGSMAVGEIVPIASAVADALAFAHERGVVHGDVKPDNVFITASGAVRMLDFGVAAEQSVASGAVATADDPVAAAATRAYASPQVLAGESPAPADDVFSLACVFYEMAAGRHPWGRRGADEAQAARQPLERPSFLTDTQWSTLAAALSWNREPRPGVRELVRGLCDEPKVEAAAAALPPARDPDVPPQPAVPPLRAGRWRLAAAIGVAFILGLALSRIAQEPPVPAPDVRRVDPVAVVAAITQGNVAATPAAEAPAEEPKTTAPSTDAPPSTEAQTASGPRPGFVAFESESMAVSSRAVVAAIPVRHFASGPQSVEVGWRILEGSAVAGRDFGGPLAGVARFAEGHTFRIIFVPITLDPSAVGERTFAVELTVASSGAAIGSMRRILVTILDDA